MFVKRLVLPCLTALILAGAFASSAQAQPAKPPEPLWTHAFDLACRKLGEADFDPKTTQKFGIESFKDNQNKLGIYISQVGSIAATGSGFKDFNKAITPSTKPEHVTGLDLPTRKAKQSDWKTAVTHSMEVFRDGNTNNWIYITEKGFLAVTPAKGGKIAGNNRPILSHSIDLKVRKADDAKEALWFGVEVYRDPSTGNLIYICSETGAVAVIAEDPATKVTGDSKDPELLYGLDLKSRKFNEFRFDKDTKKIGVEVYLDGNNGNLVYITELGTLTVTPGPKGIKAPIQAPKDPKWTHAYNIRCRKTGEPEFSDATRAFGVEVFLDENLGVVLYLSETGSLAGVKQ